MTITQKLAAILGEVDRPGDYFASGRAEFWESGSAAYRWPLVKKPPSKP